ncbi:tetratricopeptide repeat protein [bacterium]|nr:tetratricopeptide repeat protein [candidate division CSSED10-310 bacterium]
MQSEESQENDRLLIIKEGFRDGLTGIVRREAEVFLRDAPDHPEAGEVALILGIIEKGVSNAVHAKECLLKAYSSGNDEVSGHAAYEMAGLFWSLGQYDDASAWFNRASLKSGDAGHRNLCGLWEGISLFQAGKPERAVIVFDGIETSVPGELVSRLLYYRGLSRLAIGDIQQGLNDLDVLYRRPSASLKLSAALAAVQNALERNLIDVADLWCTRALQSGYSGKIQNLRGEIAFRQGNWQQAAACFAGALASGDLDERQLEEAAYFNAVSRSRVLRSSEPDWWEPLLEYVTEYPDTVRYGEILGELAGGESMRIPEIVIDYILEDRFPPDPEIYDLIANLYLNSGVPHKAFHWIARSLTRSENLDPGLPLRLAMVQMMQLTGDREAALEELGRLPEIDSGDREHDDLILQADLLFRSDSYEHAASLYQEFLIVKPEAPNRGEITFWLGESYFRVRQWSLAEKVFLAVSRDTDAPLKFRELGDRRRVLCFFNLEDWPALVDAVENYLDRYGESPLTGEMKFYEGLALANSGRPEDALAALGESLDRMSEPEYLDIIKQTMRRIESNRIEIDSPVYAPANSNYSVSPSVEHSLPDIEE